MADLEKVFGQPLLAKKNRPHRLTPAGRELAQAAQQFFQAADDLQKQAADAAPRVVVGAGEAFIQWLLFPACEAARRQGAKVTFAFKNLDSARLVEGLLQGEVDVALLRKEDVPPSLKCAGEWRYAHVAFVPKELRRATAELKVEDLASLPWALLEGQGHFRQFLESIARESHVPLNIAIECSSYAQVAMAVQTGRYAGFLPEFAKGAAFAASTSLTQPQSVKALRYERTVTLAWREATARSRPVLESLIPVLKAQLGRIMPRF